MIEWLVFEAGYSGDDSLDGRIGYCLDNGAVFQARAVDGIERITCLGTEDMMKVLGLIGGKDKSILDYVLGIDIEICDCDFDGTPFPNSPMRQE